MARPKKEISELQNEKPEDASMGNDIKSECHSDCEDCKKTIDSSNMKGRNQLEEYLWVRFQPRSSPSEQEKVQLTVNGECLIIERQIPVPLPMRFLECADRTTYATYSQEPGQLRKIINYITTFPYEKLGPATKEDYEKHKAEGTKKMKEDMVKEGTMDRREAGL